jgi:hypothetical protein
MEDINTKKFIDAVNVNNIELVRSLLNTNPELINSTTRILNVREPVNVICLTFIYRLYYEMAELLLEKGAKINVQQHAATYDFTTKEESPITHLIWYGYEFDGWGDWNVDLGRGTYFKMLELFIKNINTDYLTLHESKEIMNIINKHDDYIFLFAKKSFQHDVYELIKCKLHLEITNKIDNTYKTIMTNNKKRKYDDAKKAHQLIYELSTVKLPKIVKTTDFDTTADLYLESIKSGIEKVSYIITKKNSILIDKTKNT